MLKVMHTFNQFVTNVLHHTLFAQISSESRVRTGGGRHKRGHRRTPVFLGRTWLGQGSMALADLFENIRDSRVIHVYEAATGSRPGITAAFITSSRGGISE